MIESLAYGKENIKVFKVAIKDNLQHIISLTVQVLLSGKKLNSSYSVGENSLVVPTDTVKNTVYFLAHQHEIDTIENFGTHIVSHFFTTYSHIDQVHVEIASDGWSRMETTSSEERNKDFSGSMLSTQPTASQTVNHPHSFVKGGQEKQVFIVDAQRKGMGKFSLSAKSGIVGLTVLKTTGSNFVGFHTCPLTTLKEATDRILSTTIEAFWVYPLKEISFFSGFPYSKARSGVRQLILDLFANHNSPSVQNTLYLICEEALGIYPFLDKIEIALPNIHYWTFDLERFGIKDNGKPGRGGVFSPQADPNGVIKAVINRNKAKL